MAILPTSVTIGTGTGTNLGTVATVPAGCCGVVLAVPSGTNTVWIGNGTNLGTGTGYPIVGGSAPVHIPVVPSAGQSVLYAVATANGTVVGVILSTDK